MSARPTVLSLFSGIGGIDLAFQQAGFEIIGQIENDEFCNKVLTKHWPRVPRWGDIRDVTGGRIRAAIGTRTIDVMAGGFPCQDISVAGRGEGIQHGNRSGLWFEFARLIGELRPRIVFLENVPAITSRGGTIVIADLAAMGYDAEWGMFRASDVGAPHQRERWFCVAHANGTGSMDQQGYSGEPTERAIVRSGNVGNARRAGFQRRKPPVKHRHQAAAVSLSSRTHAGRVFKPTLGRVLDGLSGGMDGHQWPARPNESQAEWEAPRVTTAKVPHRNQRIKALGNAVVPQVVFPFAVAIRKTLELA